MNFRPLRRYGRFCARFLQGSVLFERVRVLLSLGCWSHLRHSRSFNEKNGYMKLFQAESVPGTLADKWAVRAWVAETLGAGFPFVRVDMYCPDGKTSCSGK